MFGDMFISFKKRKFVILNGSQSVYYFTSYTFWWCYPKHLCVYKVHLKFLGKQNRVVVGGIKIVCFYLIRTKVYFSDEFFLS